MKEYTITWDKSFEIGIPSIDTQHEKLFNLVRSLGTACLLKEEKQIITKLLFALEDYTKYHFKEEEDLFLLMEEKPNKKHLEEHRDFEKTLHNLKFDYVSENKEISIDLLNYLKEWLQNHILGIDMKDLNYLDQK